MMTNQAVVFDIDGVIADTRHRDHFITGEKKDWDAYFAAAVDDDPIYSRITMLDMLSFDFKILLSTGRSEVILDETTDWLFSHQVAFESMQMRSERDHRPNAALKYDHYKYWFNESVFHIVLWIDDNPVIKEALPCPVLIVPAIRELTAP